MNLILHLVRYDLLRMRGWIACWVGVLLLPIGIGALLLARSPLGDEAWRVPHTLAILAGLELLVGYVLTVLLVQEHGLVGTRQFWLTRPISRGRLLGAKALGALAIVGVVPVLVSVPWWAWCGLGPSQMARAATEMLAVLGIAIVAGALVAALTDSFARAMLWTVVLVVAGLSAMMVFTVAEAAAVRGQRESALLVARSVASVVASVLVLAAIVVVQYLVRRRGAWLAMAGAVLAGAFLGGNRWPWPWVGDVPRETNPERAAGLAVNVTRVRAQTRFPKLAVSGEEQWPRVDTTFTIAGQPEELSWFLVGVRLRWRWADGGGALRRERSFAGGGSDPVEREGLRWQWPPTDPETQRFMEELYTKRKEPRWEPPREGEATVPMWLPPSLVARAEKDPPRYDVLAYLEVGRTLKEFEGPLAPGGWQRTEVGRTRIERLERDGTVAKAVVVRTRPVLLRDDLRRVAASGAWFYAEDRERGRDSQLLAINRARSEVTSFERSGAERRAALVNGVEIEWFEATAEAPRIIRGGKWTPVPGWMDGATLGGLGFRKEAGVLRTVTVERLELAK